MDSGDVVFATKLNGNESLLKNISEISKLDGSVKLENKGKNLFDGKSSKLFKNSSFFFIFVFKFSLSDADISQIYIQLILECIYHWKTKFPFEGDRKTPTNFAKTFAALEAQHVIFPKPEEFNFVALKPKKKNNAQSQIQQPPPPVNESKVNNNSNKNNSGTPGVNLDNQKENLRTKYS